MKYILDASVVAKLFLDEEMSEMAGRLVENALDGKLELHAPSLLFFEINHALVKSNCPKQRREEALNDLFQLIDDRVLRIHEIDNATLKKAGTIAELETGQGYISTYDATYHALAIVENAVFLTDDKKHYKKTQPILGAIALLEDLTF